MTRQKFYIFVICQSFTYFLHFNVLHISYISKFYIFLTFQSFTYFLHFKVLHFRGIQQVYICTVCCVNISFIFKFLTCTKCSTFLTCQSFIFTFLTVLQYFYHVNCFTLTETFFSFNTIKTSKLTYTVSNFFLNTFKNTHYMHVV